MNSLLHQSINKRIKLQCLTDLGMEMEQRKYLHTPLCGKPTCPWPDRSRSDPQGVSEEPWKMPNLIISRMKRKLLCIYLSLPLNGFFLWTEMLWQILAQFFCNVLHSNLGVGDIDFVQCDPGAFTFGAHWRVKIRNILYACKSETRIESVPRSSVGQANSF